MKYLLTLVLLLFAVPALALPTTTAKKLTWTNTTDPDLDRVYVYYRPQMAGTEYTDEARLELPKETTEVILIDMTFSSKEACFVVTSADNAGNESAFSNEVCGFMGFPSPTGLELQ